MQLALPQTDQSTECSQTEVIQPDEDDSRPTKWAKVDDKESRFSKLLGDIFIHDTDDKNSSFWKSRDKSRDRVILI